MDFRLITIGLSLLLVAGCGCVQKGDPDSGGEVTAQSKEHKLILTVKEFRRHCGGMAPTPEMEANRTQPASGVVYYIYEGTRPSQKSDFTRVVANGEGVITIELPDGDYEMIQEDKLLSLKEFIALKKIGGVHYRNKPDTCYEDWRNKPDFSVALRSDSTVLFTINHKCFTGTNPCLEYTGPYPP